MSITTCQALWQVCKGLCRVQIIHLDGIVTADVDCLEEGWGHCWVRRQPKANTNILLKDIFIVFRQASGQTLCTPQHWSITLFQHWLYPSAHEATYWLEGRGVKVGITSLVLSPL